LDLGDNLIEKVTGFSNTPNLEDLSLQKNPITTIGKREFNQLSNLYSLDLSFCQIDDYSHFEGLEQLSKLDVSQNVKFTKFSQLPELGFLSDLLCHHCDIESLVGIGSRCPELTVLNIGFNKLETIASIKPLAELESLADLRLEGNPISVFSSLLDEVRELVPNLEQLDEQELAAPGQRYAEESKKLLEDITKNEREEQKEKEAKQSREEIDA
jgi:Leucine-rich repeat (LRR) protein